MTFNQVIVTVEVIAWVTPVLALLSEVAFEPLEGRFERIFSESAQAALHRQAAKPPLGALPLSLRFFRLLALEFGNFFSDFFLGAELVGKALIKGFRWHR
jgi:hypothetical protein